MSAGAESGAAGRVWLITGISRGLGLALARHVLARGERVVGTVRGAAPALPAGSDRLRVLTADLSALERIPGLVQQAAAAFGRIDVVVNNAGHGLLGAVETLPDAAIDRLFAVDVHAPIRLCRAVLPLLRRQGQGHIVNITSIAGRAPGPGTALYAAAKHAMEGFSAALAQDLAGSGIRVTAVAPGQFRTGFLDHSDRAGGDPEGDTVGTAMAALAGVSGRQIGDPDRAAEAIHALVAAPEAPRDLLLGSDALDRARRQLDSLTREMAAWEAVTLGTDYR
ncbi:SDR family NAD(P)-dependent oxidoreductase [Roseivivax sp. CAU 1761]